MDNLMFSLNATLPVFLVMVIGWALGQKGFLPKQFCTVADKLVFKVTLPVMLFCDMATLDLAHSFDAKFVLFCFAVTAIAIVVIWVLARRLLKDKTLVGEFVQASYRSSAAILGVAFIQNIYGTSCMACFSLSYAVGLVAMLGYFLTPEWGKLRRKAKELGDAVTAETEPTL